MRNERVAIDGNYYRELISGRAHGLWPSAQRAGLHAASIPYGWVMQLRNRLYDLGWKRSHRANVPVVSIGNLTLGGTGKTPCVEYVSDFYQRHGKCVAILSRGYGGNGGPNDESRILRENLPEVPHLQDADRSALASRAIADFQSDILVLDDGFQHRRLARDLDVVLVDATQARFHQRLFPRGLLRESWDGLRRAQAVIVTRSDQVGPQERGRLEEAITDTAPAALVVRASHRPIELKSADGRIAPLIHLKERPIAAFCGIGNPDAFRRTLTACGAQFVAFRRYPDHHAYTRQDVTRIEQWTERLDSDTLLVTTQKDLVKLRPLFTNCSNLWAVRVRFHIERGQDELERELLNVAGLTA